MSAPRTDATSAPAVGHGFVVLGDVDAPSCEGDACDLPAPAEASVQVPADGHRTVG